MSNFSDFIDPWTYLTYAQNMLRGILLCFLSISALFPLISKENVLILTTTRKNFDIYNNLIETNIENINYEVELILVEDNYNESDEIAPIYDHVSL